MYSDICSNVQLYLSKWYSSVHHRCGQPPAKNKFWWPICHAAASMVPEIDIAVCPWEKRTLKGHCRMTPNCRIQKREAGTAVATIEIIKTRLEDVA
jgi:hypothetical protein